MPYIVLLHQRLKLHLKNKRRPRNSWKFKGSSQRPLDQIRNKEIKDFLEFNKNECATYPKFWQSMEAVQ